MIGIRQKLMLVFGGLIVFIAGVSLLTMAQIDQLGRASNVILKENYRSVVACQDMLETLERIDSGVLFVLSGNRSAGDALIADNIPRFQRALQTELGNITLPNERENAEGIEKHMAAYLKILPRITGRDTPLSHRKTLYFSELQPLFLSIKTLTQNILVMNQKNMSDASEAAKKLALKARRRMMALVAVTVLLAMLFSYLARRWILLPITRLMESTENIRQGDLDLVVETRSRDEIGKLSESFNEMASVLRKTRIEDRFKLMRTRKITAEVFKALPATLAVLDPDGRVEVSTDTAERYFGLAPGTDAHSLGHAWLEPLMRKALRQGRAAESDPGGAAIQVFFDNRELFFQPVAVPIAAGHDPGSHTGVALIMNDVTQLHEQKELKQGVLSTASHQLKTPLTSLRMAVHLLLEERVGSLNDKQAELLMAARDDSERLSVIVDDLLNLNRIESGNALVHLEAVEPADLAGNAMDAHAVECRDKGVNLRNDVPIELPPVMADQEKISHVYANLIGNALRFTPPGGAIRLYAARDRDAVVFHVEDTGRGIPAECLGRIFDPFFRVPGQSEKSGVGLGLAIVREIIRAHDGCVTVESTVGKGSVFTFSLPMKS